MGGLQKQQRGLVRKSSIERRRKRLEQGRKEKSARRLFPRARKGGKKGGFDTQEKGSRFGGNGSKALIPNERQIKLILLLRIQQRNEAQQQSRPGGGDKRGAVRNAGKGKPDRAIRGGRSLKMKEKHSEFREKAISAWEEQGHSLMKVEEYHMPALGASVVAIAFL